MLPHHACEPVPLPAGAKILWLWSDLFPLQAIISLAGGI